MSLIGEEILKITKASKVILVYRAKDNHCVVENFKRDIIVGPSVLVVSSRSKDNISVPALFFFSFRAPMFEMGLTKM